MSDCFNSPSLSPLIALEGAGGVGGAIASAALGREKPYSDEEESYGETQSIQ